MASSRLFPLYAFVFTGIITQEVKSSDRMPSPSFPDSIAPILRDPLKVKVQMPDPEDKKPASTSKDRQPANPAEIVKPANSPQVAQQNAKAPEAVVQKLSLERPITKLGQASLTKANPQLPENPPMSLIKDREPWTITLKPLNVNLSTLTFGIRRKAQLINNYPIDPYRSSWGYLMNRSDRAGVGYDIEAGIMITRNVEIFTILGFSVEQPFNKIIVSTPSAPGGNLAFDFKTRHNYEVSLGSRYYWNSIKPWFPFVGFMGTITFQDSVRSDVFNVINPFTQTYSPTIGSLTLQGRKTFVGGTLLAGADYQITPLIAATFSVGLRYMPRTSLTYTSIAGNPVSCRDNRNLWSLPVMVSLKMTF